MKALRCTSSLLVAVALFAVSTAGAQERADAGRFTGSLRGRSGSTGSSMDGVPDATKFSGTMLISPSPTREGIWKVELRLSTPSSTSATTIMQWSISPGRCGSRVQPLVSPTEVSPIEMRSGGAADAMWEGRMALSFDGSYQLVVYGRGGVREQDIVACGNLKYNKPKP